MLTILPAANSERTGASELAALDRALEAGIIDQAEHDRRLRLLLRRFGAPIVVTKGAPTCNS